MEVNAHPACVQLKTARLSQGFTTREIAQVLGCKTSLIEALEECDEKNLPEPILVVGMLRRYARHLGLDADEIVSNYPIQVPPPPYVRHQPPSPLRWGVPLIILLLVMIALVLLLRP